MSRWPEMTVVDRLWSHVDRSGGPDACWEWTASLGSHGYGQFYVDGPVMRRPHRVAYEATIGPVPDGTELDHLCRNRACVNPSHLEPVSHRENTLRGITLPAINAQKTHCIRGHEFSPDNLIGSSYRRCRQCHRDGKRRRRAERAA